MNKRSQSISLAYPLALRDRLILIAWAIFGKGTTLLLMGDVTLSDEAKQLLINQ